MSDVKITLENMEQFSMETIFNYLVGLVVKQGRKSCDSGSCLYRANGLMCAFGPMIPDSFYRSDLEGKVAEYISRLYYEETNKAEYLYTLDYKKKIEMLHKLQTKHDSSPDGMMFLHYFMTYVKNLATSLNIKLNPELDINYDHS